MGTAPAATVMATAPGIRVMATPVDMASISATTIAATAMTAMRAEMHDGTNGRTVANIAGITATTIDRWVGQLTAPIGVQSTLGGSWKWRLRVADAATKQLSLKRALPAAGPRMILKECKELT